MLKWIGIEESLLQLELQREYVKVFMTDAEMAGLQIQVVNDTTELNLSEGILILDGLSVDSCFKDIIGQMPVIGFVSPGEFDCYGIRYVIESFEGIDVVYLNMVYNRFHGISLTIANTGRVVLREITVEDVPALYEAGISLQNSQGIVSEDCAGLVMKQHVMEAELKEELEYVSAYINGMYHYYNYGMWALCKPSKELLGIAGYDHIDQEDLPVDSKARAVAEICFCLQAGYHICYNYRRQGYGLEALQAVVRYGFEYIGVEAVLLLIEPHNIPSLKLAQKAGFSSLERTLYQGKEVEVYIIAGGCSNA